MALLHPRRCRDRVAIAGEPLRSQRSVVVIGQVATRVARRSKAGRPPFRAPAFSRPGSTAPRRPWAPGGVAHRPAPSPPAGVRRAPRRRPPRRRPRTPGPCVGLVGGPTGEGLGLPVGALPPLHLAAGDPSPVIPHPAKRTAPDHVSAGQGPIPVVVSEGGLELRRRPSAGVQMGPSQSTSESESDGLSPRRFAKIRRRPAGLVTNPVTNLAILVGSQRPYASRRCRTLMTSTSSTSSSML